jgi:hypothetical protein
MARETRTEVPHEKKGLGFITYPVRLDPEPTLAVGDARGQSSSEERRGQDEREKINK